MKIEKRISIWNDGKMRFYYCYNSNVNWIHHGLYNDYSGWGVGYHYHGISKGFCLRNKDML